MPFNKCALSLPYLAFKFRFSFHLLPENTQSLELEMHGFRSQLEYFLPLKCHSLTYNTGPYPTLFRRL